MKPSSLVGPLLALGAVGLAAGCHRSSSGSDEGTPAPAVSVLPAPPGLFALEDGTTLKLPEGALLLNLVRPPPPGQVSSRIFNVPSEGVILTVALARPAAQTCDAILAGALAQAGAVGADPKLGRAGAAEKRVLGGHPAAYTEAATRSAQEAQFNMPYHATASYVVCTKGASVKLTLSLLHGEMNDRARKVLDAVATSVAF